MSVSVWVVHVHIRLKPATSEAFVAATLAHVHESLAEPGVARFDLVQGIGDPDHFVLVEVYRSQAAIEAHRRSDHHASWLDVVEPLVSEQSSVRYRSAFPDDFGW
ncbi:MAG: putative quinol monooxygenase [Polyangiales bacterium]